MVGMGVQDGQAPAVHIAQLDARFHSMLSNLDCHENTLARLGELRITNISALTTLVDDRAELRVFLKDALGLDPVKGYQFTLEAGKVVMAWEQANKRTEVENKRDAERRAADLPPQLTGEDVVLLKKQFEKNFNKNRVITKAQTPSKSYLELKVGHAESMWQAEKLMEVTSLAQEERHKMKNSNEKSMAVDEVNCSFKIITKPFGVPMPTDSEGLRARLKLMGNAFMFLRLKLPQKGVLSTCTPEVWSHYTEFLFGDEVWNFATIGESGQPVACPHQGIVMAYDQAIRESVASLMSEGKDMEAAFDLAMGNISLRQTAFLSNFNIENGSSRCRALSAPGFRDIHGSLPTGTKRKLEDGEPTTRLTKGQKKARAKAKAGATAQLALKDLKRSGGGGRDRKRTSQGQAQAILDKVNTGGPGGGKDKGSGKGKLKIRTAANVPICFAFNNGEACKSIPCNFAHVCQVCEGDHAKTSPLCKGAA